MNAYEYAIYRYASRRMSRYQRTKALALAEKADAGDKSAASALKQMVDRVIRSANHDAENDGAQDESHEDKSDHAA